MIVDFGFLKERERICRPVTSKINNRNSSIINQKQELDAPVTLCAGVSLAACLYGGCFAFALSQAKHWKVVFPGKLDF